MMNKPSNKQLLTVLGCSSSVALSLLTVGAAEASTNKEYVFTAPDVSQELAEIPQSEADYPFFDCTCSEYDADMIEQVDREGEKAIARYGCDCAGCRRLVRSLDKMPKVNTQIIE